MDDIIKNKETGEVQWQKIDEIPEGNSVLTEESEKSLTGNVYHIDGSSTSNITATIGSIEHIPSLSTLSIFLSKSVSSLLFLKLKINKSGFTRFRIYPR